MAEAGEGYVVYLTAHSDIGSSVVWLGKLKTAEYRLLRRMRERAKHFARSGGRVLVEEVLDSYRREALAVGEPLATEKVRTLEKLCSLIYAEDIPPEEVDENFLHLAQRADAYDGKYTPRKPAPAVCVVAPPFAAAPELLQSLQQLLEMKAQSMPGSLPSLDTVNLTSAWQDSTAAKPRIFLNHVPYCLERLLFPGGAGASGSGAAEPAAKRRRLAREAVDERRGHGLQRIASSYSRRCLFIFCGWGEPMAKTQPLTRWERKLREPASGAFLKKLQAQAVRLHARVPGSLWLSSSGFSSAAIEGAWARAQRPEQLPTVVAVIPLAVPGMGKSSLLEALFRRCQEASDKCFRQGLPVHRAEAATSPTTSTLASAAIVSSDAFTGVELKLLGSASSEDVASCRRRAQVKYRRAIDDFLAQAAAGVAGPPHLLLLDKNHPPASLTKEVEALSSACRSLGCQLQPKVLYLEAKDEVRRSQMETELLQEEDKHFGAWDYPWSPDVITECAARLLLRSSHDTLAAGDMSLSVLLSFVQLHKGFSLDKAGPVVKVPFLCTGALASWRPVDDEVSWRRLEIRALLRQVLQQLKPFRDHKLQPLLVALASHLSPLQLPDEEAQLQHLKSCADGAWRELLQVEAKPWAPSLRYIALDVEAHHEALDGLLSKLSLAMCAVTDTCDGDMFPAPFFQRPESLHVTTCYLGTDTQREVVSASKRLYWEGTAFDCRVSHIVGARSALAFAVVEGSELRGSGCPLAEKQRPHVTLCTQSPWRPKHCNEVLEAIQPWLADDTVHAAGKWIRHVRLKSSVLDVFILQLETPVLLRANPLRLC